MDANNAIEACEKTGKVRKKQECYHQLHEAEPLFTVELDNLQAAAEKLHKRIKTIRRNEGVGTYLFVDRELNAYPISESRPCAKDWVRTRFKELVGYYNYVRRNDLPILKPTIEGLLEDLQDHIQDLRTP